MVIQSLRLINFLALVVALFDLSSFSASADSADPVKAEAIFKQMLDTYASLKSYSDNGDTSNTLDTFIDENGQKFDWSDKFEIQMERPAIFKLVRHSRFEAMAGGIFWSKGEEIYYKFFDLKGNDFKSPDGTIVKKAENLSEGIEHFGARHDLKLVPRLFFGLETRVQEECSLFDLEPDDSVDGIACYVLNGQITNKKDSTSDSKITLWIGKEDHLLHKYQSIFHAVTTIQVHSHIVVNHDIDSATFPSP